ncbi:MAG: PAS domain S-box protein [Candidatus Marinimicrobia bacterium]|nr:PAS domain S-box protein [Candidatus Neomarinimicrobiota bacterium]
MKNKIKFKYIIAYLGILAFPIAINTNSYLVKKNQYIQKSLEKEKLAYDIIIESNLKTANDIFEAVVNQPEVINILKKAQNPDKGFRDNMRNQLYTLLKNDYNRIKRRNIRQFQFVLPNCESFLRFHRPDRYGDNLSDIRYSLKKANTELLPVYGFEEGTTYNGFRNVFPIISNGEHLGAVEISMSYKSIIDNMDKLFDQKHSFIIRKDVVYKKVIKTELLNYKISDVCDEFMYESDVVSDEFSTILFKRIQGKIYDKLQKGLSFSLEIKISEKYYLISFQSIKNIKGEAVAYVISHEEDNTIHNYFIRFIFMLFLSSLIIFLFFTLLLLTLKKNKTLKLVHKDLKNSENRFKQFSNLTLEGIVIHDKGIALDINASLATMFGYEPDEIIGNNVIKMLIMEKDHPTIQNNIIKERTAPYEIEGIRKDGSTLPLELEARDIIDINNRKVRVVAVRNISRRKKIEKEKNKIEAQLRQSQKLEGIGQLAGGIAHDFNNILAVQYGYTEIAMLDAEKEPKIYQALVQIQDSNERAAKLVRQILAFSRKQAFTPEVININQAIFDLNKMVHRLIEENIKIILNLSKKDLLINADPSQIEQIIINLFINARDAIKSNKNINSKKQIVIKTEMINVIKPFITLNINILKGQYVLVSITDTGIGMDKETLSKIFEPFFTTKEVGQGTGLGLSTVFGIVKQNKGYITAYSEPGIGTTFKIYWPTSEEIPQNQSSKTIDKKN